MKKVGLALGSGGTKGFAHIGILQEFEENGVPIDLISGCSIGAIMGAIYAVGTDLHMLEKFGLSMNMRQYLDFADPRHGGLLRGVRLEELIRIFTHDLDFEQTRIPFCCVALNVGTGKTEVFDSGKLHTYVRASMSIPGFFLPVRIGDSLYVDGGVLDRVPIMPLREKGADIVIGVDVSYRGGSCETKDMNAYESISRAIDLMQWEIAKEKNKSADLLLTPDISYVKGHLQLEHAERCVEEGRKSAREAMPEIRKLLSDNGISLRPSAAPANPV